MTGNSTAQVAQEAESQPVQDQAVPAKTCSVATVPVPQTTTTTTTPGATADGSESVGDGTTTINADPVDGTQLVAPSPVTASTTTVVNYNPSTLTFITADQFGGPEVDEQISLPNFGQTTDTSTTPAAETTAVQTADPTNNTDQPQDPVCDPPAEDGGAAPISTKPSAPVQAGNIEQCINLFISWIKAHEGFIT